MDAPILHVFESHHATELGTGEFRMYRLDPIENEPMTPSGPATPGPGNLCCFEKTETAYSN